MAEWVFSLTDDELWLKLDVRFDILRRQWKLFFAASKWRVSNSHFGIVWDKNRVGLRYKDIASTVINKKNCSNSYQCHRVFDFCDSIFVTYYVLKNAENFFLCFFADISRADADIGSRFTEIESPGRLL